MAKTHELKCWPAPFQALADGRKTCEWRKNDRDYDAGDTLHLREWNPGDWAIPVGRYTGRELRLIVTDIQHGRNWGIPEGYVMMSVKPVDTTPAGAPAADSAPVVRGILPRGYSAIKGTDVWEVTLWDGRILRMTEAEIHAAGYVVGSKPAPAASRCHDFALYVHENQSAWRCNRCGYMAAVPSNGTSCPVPAAGAATPSEPSICGHCRAEYDDEHGETCDGCGVKDCSECVPYNSTTHTQYCAECRPIGWKPDIAAGAPAALCDLTPCRKCGQLKCSSSHPICSDCDQLAPAALETTAACSRCGQSWHDHPTPTCSPALAPAAGAATPGDADEETWQHINRALKGYHLQYTHLTEDDGDSLPLVDALTPPGDGSIERGLQEIELLTDAIWQALAQGGGKGG